MSDKTPKRLKALLDDLFSNVSGEEATRLKLIQEREGERTRDLGGWNRIAVMAVLLKHFPELAND